MSRYAAMLDPSRQLKRMGSLAKRFSPSQLSGASRAFFEHLFAAAGDGDDGAYSRLAVYGAMSDPDFSPASALSPEFDAELAKARAEGVAEGRKIEAERFAAVLADERVKGREEHAIKLLIAARDMSVEATAAWIAAHVPVASAKPAIPRLAERMGKIGKVLTLGPGPAANTSSTSDAVARVNRARGFTATGDPSLPSR